MLCVQVLRAKTLIGHCILFEKAFNTKIHIVIYFNITLLLAVFLLDLELVCKVCEFLSDE